MEFTDTDESGQDIRLDFECTSSKLSDEIDKKQAMAEKIRNKQKHNQKHKSQEFKKPKKKVSPYMNQVCQQLS